ncbi:MAG: type III polyketide synthase [Bacteroidetes bacterium]|nr:MAG: type III polyketide synthase [Bacteroidota bacterium]
MSVIVGIGTANPDYKLTQEEAYTFMKEFYSLDEDEGNRLSALYKRSGIKQRYSCVPDYNQQLHQKKLFPHTPDLTPFPGIEKRMAIYAEEAPLLGEQAINNLYAQLNALWYKPQHITHLITVSCTGMSAPGLDLMLLEKLQLAAHTQRTSVNFMGCYAAVHALKMAHQICTAQTNAQVLIVCVELCSIHFQNIKSSDNITANAIFADGAAACLMVSDDLAKHNAPQLLVKGFYSEVHVGGKKDMAWQISSSGFLMTLSAYIPQFIEAAIADLITRALSHYGVQKTAIEHWAIHPGGRKILDVTLAKLSLNQHDLAYSYQVLRDYGNMSSPTILFVLKAMMDDHLLNGNIFGTAFGPGLTMETFLFAKTSSNHES